MSSVALEAYLAKLYTDAAARERFLANPESAARDAGLDTADALALRHIDLPGLRMAAASYAHKRAQHQRPKNKRYLQWLVGWLRTR